MQLFNQTVLSVCMHAYPHISMPCKVLCPLISFVCRLYCPFVHLAIHQSHIAHMCCMWNMLISYRFNWPADHWSLAPLLLLLPLLSLSLFLSLPCNKLPSSNRPHVFSATILLICTWYFELIRLNIITEYNLINRKRNEEWNDKKHNDTRIISDRYQESYKRRAMQEDPNTFIRF